MPSRNLSVKFIERVKPPASGRAEYYDTQSPAVLRVTSKGAKSWCCYYRFGGMHQRLTLGSTAIMGLEEARESARDIRKSVKAGRDPKVDRKRRARRGLKFQQLADRYVAYARDKKQKRTWREDQRQLEKDVLPTWNDITAREITRGDVKELLSTVEERAPVSANRLLALLRRMFNWAIDEDLISSSPCAGIKPPTKEKSRDRVLSDEEIRSIWPALDELGYPFGTCIQLLFLTGQRREEVAGMFWSEVDFDKALWTIPRERNKTDTANEVPLTPAAVELLSNLPRLDDHVFTTNGRTSISGFSRVKRLLDERSGVTDWRVHDIRRTVATNMAQLNVAPHVVEKILNHRTGELGGVAGIYNRFGYLDEKRSALEASGHRLYAVVGATEPVDG